MNHKNVDVIFVLILLFGRKLHDTLDPLLHDLESEHFEDLFSIRYLLNLHPCISG